MISIHIYTIFNVTEENKRGINLDTYITRFLLIPQNMQYAVCLHEIVI